MRNVFQDYACHFSELCTNYIQGYLSSFEMIRLSRACVSPCQYSIATMAVSCIIFEIKRAIGRKSLFFFIFSYPPHSISLLVGPDRNIAILFRTENQNSVTTRRCKTFYAVFSHFDSIWYDSIWRITAYDGLMDRQMDVLWQLHIALCGKKSKNADCGCLDCRKTDISLVVTV